MHAYVYSLVIRHMYVYGRVGRPADQPSESNDGVTYIYDGFVLVPPPFSPLSVVYNRPGGLLIVVTLECY